MTEPRILLKINPLQNFYESNAFNLLSNLLLEKIKDFAVGLDYKTVSQ